MIIKEYLINLELEKLNNHIKKLEKFNAPKTQIELLKTQIELLKTVKKENIEKGRTLRIRAIDKEFLNREVINVEIIKLYKLDPHIRFNKIIHLIGRQDGRKELIEIEKGFNDQYTVLKTLM